MCLCLMLCVYVFLISVLIASEQFLIMRPFQGRKEQLYKIHKRKRTVLRYKNKTVRHAKLRESVGIVESKKVLRSALLNIDGLSEASLASYEKLG